jgi:hypothetical protein
VEKLVEVEKIVIHTIEKIVVKEIEKIGPYFSYGICEKKFEFAYGQNRRPMALYQQQ